MADTQAPDRYHWLERLLEMVPGVISWAVLIGPIWLSFSYPWLVAYFVLSFDFYWLCRALWFSGAVIVAYRRIRDVLAVDWLVRCASLGDRAARRRVLALRLSQLGNRASGGALGLTPSSPVAGWRASSAERRRIRKELVDLEAVDQLDGQTCPPGTSTCTSP